MFESSCLRSPRHRFRSYLGSVLLALTAAACGGKGPEEPKTQNEVGTIRASVVSVGLWKNYVSALQPEFSLTADKALDAIAPTTQVVDQRELDVLGVGARVALPTTTVVSTTNVLPDGKPATDPGQTTTTSKTGDASGLSLPSSTAGTRTAAGLSPLGKPDDATLGMEPMLRYWTATALYQEVQLINRYVRDAAVQEQSYDAYVVRLQVGLMPRRRDLQYDAYANVSFFLDADNCSPPAIAPSCKLPLVLPLLASDSIEGALHAATADRLRNYALALSGMVNGIGILGDVDKLRETLDRLAGRDLNSLLMVSRLSGNTLRIRMGAVQQGAPRFAMMPQNRFVTAVVMVPKTYAPPAGTPKRLKIETSSQVIDVRTGQSLPTKSTEADQRDVEAIRADHGLCKAADFDEAWNGILNHDWWAFRTEVCQHRSGEHDTTESTECKNDQEPEACGNLDQLRQIWGELAALEADYGVDALQVELPDTTTGTLPASQVVLLSDDKKDATVGVLAGGTRLAAGTLCAALKLPLGHTVAARELEVLGGGTQVRVTFPSLKRFKLDNQMQLGVPAVGPAPVPPTLVLGTGETPSLCWANMPAQAVAPAPPLAGTYSVVYAQIDQPDPNPGFTLKVLSGLITAKGGKGTLRLELSPDAGPLPIATSVLVALSGADVEKVSGIQRPAAGAPTPLPAYVGVGAEFLVPLVAAQTAVIDVDLINAKDGTELKIDARNPTNKGNAPSKSVKIVAASP